MKISGLVYSLISFYSLLIFIRIFMTWIPNIDWHQQPIKWVREVTDAYLNLFRFIPPIGMLDISPMVALFVLWILQGMITGMIASLGL